MYFGSDARPHMYHLTKRFDRDVILDELDGKYLMKLHRYTDGPSSHHILNNWSNAMGKLKTYVMLHGFVDVIIDDWLLFKEKILLIIERDDRDEILNQLIINKCDISGLDEIITDNNNQYDENRSRHCLWEWEYAMKCFKDIRNDETINKILFY